MCHKPTSGLAPSAFGSAGREAKQNARMTIKRIVLRARHRYVESRKNPNDATEREAEAITLIW
jgi:hypothetical protein